MADKGTSVLATLTANVMEEKSKAARQLTPVEGEKRGAPPITPAVRVPDVPGDFLTDDGLRMVAENLRRDAQYMMKVADGIDQMRGTEASPMAEPVSIEDAKRAKEREADARAAVAAAKDPDGFKADFDAKVAAAQAATFKEDEPKSTNGGWLCPLHERAIDKVSPKSGRQYRGCPDCNLFER